MAQDPDDTLRSKHSSLCEFDAYTDRNSQDSGQDKVQDVGLPAKLQRELHSDPSRQAETARTASGSQRIDSVSGGSAASVEATEAETPPENLRHIDDASTSPNRPN